MNKFNVYTDASIRMVKNKDRTFIGGYITNHENKIIFTFFEEINIKLSTNMIAMAEGISILKGLNHLSKICEECEEINIHTDNLFFVELIQRKMMLTDSDDKKIKFSRRFGFPESKLDEIKKLRDEVYDECNLISKKFSISHIMREKNQYADFLTHYAKWRVYNNMKELKQNAKDASKIHFLSEKNMDFSDLYQSYVDNKANKQKIK